MYYEVLVAGKQFHGNDSLTYTSDEKLAVGQLVAVSVRGRSAVGVIEQQSVTKPTFKTSTIEMSYPYTLPYAQFELLQWLRTYYPGPLGSIVDLFVTNLAAYKEIPEPLRQSDSPMAILPDLTDEQRVALETLSTSGNEAVLLHGDTGTGKTRLYVERARQVLEQGKSVLVLCPEIGLTEPLRERFAEAFPDHMLQVLHSSKSAKKRRESWAAIQQAKDPIIIIGARSALFAPINNLGLIILDEAHDGAYKQEQQPYYQATRVAAQLARLSGCQLILGTATPLVQDYFAFAEKKLPIIRLRKPAIKHVSKVVTTTVDLKDKSLFSRSRTISTPLLETMQQALGKNEQCMIFLNRRGSARLVLCSDCGWQALCPNCDVSLVYHSDKHRMLCHSCGFYQEIPARCPECKSSELIYSVAGTKALEQELARHFPQARIQRFDRDTEAAQKIDKLFADVASGKIDIVIGTQGIVKGFDLPNLSVVGIIHGDSGLQIADYGAVERTYQLISQVAGRLGRGHRDGTLVLQTANPDSELLRWAVGKDYEQFYSAELKHRRAFNFPPYAYLLKIIGKRATQASAKASLEKLLPQLSTVGGIQVLGPSPCYPEKLAGSYRWQLVIKSKDRKKLVQLLANLPKNYSHDLDPNSLL